MQQRLISQEIGQMLKTNFPLPLATAMRPVVNGALGIGRVDKIYNNACRLNSEGNFAENVLTTMNVKLTSNSELLTHIPAEGPLVVVANHPYGAIEGMALLSLLRQIRPDVKLLANHLLGKVPELQNDLLLVNPFGGKAAARDNLSGIRSALRYLKEGHVLGVFPAGEVSSFQPEHGVVADGKWAETVGMLIRKAECNVICVYFDGHNSHLFQMMGMVHPRLRTLLLPREFLRNRNQALPFKISNMIPAEKCAEFESAGKLMDYLRMRTYVLSSDGKTEQRRKSSKLKREQRLARFKPRRRMEPIIGPVDQQLLTEEMSRLDADCLLLESGQYKVYCAPADRIPVALTELGRLREETFRAAGEGTGKASDTDWWDLHYRHLILWSGEEREIIGAYRMGLADELLKKFGREGLYSATLFHYSDKMLEALNPSMELGRSFIQQKYQKNPVALGLLWKGIVAFICRNPQYSKLFGPVSISNEYHSMSKQMLVEFLQDKHFDDALAGEVKAVCPPKIKPVKLWDRNCRTMLKKIEDVDELIAEIEPHLKNAPVLIRQYLRLNGKFLSFNIDPKFGNSLDALILCDIANAPVIAKRYMGKEKYEDFLVRRAELGIK